MIRLDFTISVLYSGIRGSPFARLPAFTRTSPRHRLAIFVRDRVTRWACDRMVFCVDRKVQLAELAFSLPHLSLLM